jgi:uncharacterized membrane protein
MSPDKIPIPHNAHPFRRRVLSGVLVVVPLVITWKVLEILLGLLGDILLPFIQAAFPFLADYEWLQWLISIVALIGLIYVVGALAGHVVGRRFIRYLESLVERIPLISPIYSATRQVIETILISDGVSFKSVVLVEFPRNGAHSLGFVTGTLENAGQKLQKVFVPTSPNPTSGFLIIVPTHECIHTTLTVEEGIRYVVSAGILAIDDLDKIIKPFHEQPQSEAESDKRGDTDAPAD